MGKQVAINRALHYTMELWEDENGEYQPILRGERLALIKGEYLPIGKVFIFPKKWGRKKGAEVLLEHLIKDSNKIISSTKERLDKLQRTKEGVAKWNDD